MFKTTVFIALVALSHQAYSANETMSDADAKSSCIGGGTSDDCPCMTQRGSCDCSKALCGDDCCGCPRSVDNDRTNQNN